MDEFKNKKKHYLLMPDVKDAGISCPDDLNVRPHVFAEQDNVFAAPAHNFLVKAPNLEEIRAILASHAVAKVPPEAGVTGDEQLIRLRWQLFRLQCVNNVRIIQRKNHWIINLLRDRVK